MNIAIKYLISLAVGFFVFSSGVAQINASKAVRYNYTDARSINKDETVLLFSDRTFISCGIVNDVANLDIYMWYAYGQWTNIDSTVTFNTQAAAFKADDVVDLVKREYKNHPDFRLIQSYYEFVNVKLTEYTYTKTKDGFMDDKKKISLRLKNAL